jgi:uncharacterized protein (TIGR03663 family)
MCRSKLSLHWRSGCGAALVFLCALFLRLHELEARPFHTDEAVQGIKTGRLLEGGGYRYDPTEYHGPTLHYAAALLARLRGETTLSELSGLTLRLLPVVFSLATLALLVLWIPMIGPAAAFWAAVFTTLSPIQLYYSRYFIHEPLLVFFTFAFLTCLARYLRAPHWKWALSAGLAGGLMLATKETAIVYAPVPGLFFVWHRCRTPASSFPLVRNHLVLLILGTAVVWLLFFSSFLQHPRGLADSLLTFRYSAARAGGQGHEKPAWTYLHWLLAWRTPAGLHTEALLPLLSLGLLWPRTGRDPVRPLLAAAGLIIALFSLIPYKTPWLMLVPMQWLALTAGAGAAALLRRSREWKATGAVFLLLIAGTLHLGEQGFRQAYRHPADERTPYAYSHTHPEFPPAVKRLLAELETLSGPDRTILVGAKEYWPLPWTLRRQPRVGYWNTLPPRLDAPLLFLGEAESRAAAPLLLRTHAPLTFTLRSGVLLTAWLRRDLAQRTEDPAPTLSFHGFRFRGGRGRMHVFC